MFLSALLFIAVAQAETDLCVALPPPAPAVESFTTKIKEVAECTPLSAVGDARVHDRTANNTRANDTRLTLRRLPNNVYEAAFNINFVTGGGGTTSSTAMLERVKNCLINVPATRGPGGRSLIFRAYSAAEAQSQLPGVVPPSLEIKITPVGGRGSATEFRDDFTCGHIIHELMHHAGLCDEYRESGFGIADANRNDGWCRQLGPGDSLMSSGMITAYDDAAGSVFSCDLSSESNWATHLPTKTPQEQRDLLRMSFRTIGNFRPSDVGLTSAPGDNAKNAFCRRVSEKWVPFVAGKPGIILKKNEPTQLEFTSREHSLNSAGLAQTYEIEYSCDCAGQGSFCFEYLNLTRPQVVAASDSARTLFGCPGSSAQKPPRDFSVPPGSLKLSGTEVFMHNQPAPARNLLYPGQFEKLLDGPCNQPSAQTYNRCAALAYRHSSPGSIRNNNGANRCDPVPAECKTPQGWLGNL